MKSPFTLKPATQQQMLAAFDNTQANAEGWALFNDGELQRLDNGPIIDNEQSGEPIFANDTEAFGYVSACAANGSQYHKDALLAVSPEWVNKLVYGIA